MGEWKELPLGTLTTKIGSGATPSGGSNSYKLEGISLIRSQNVLDLGFSYDGLALIDDEQADGLRNVIVQKDDVLLNITGDSVARVCKVPEDVLPARVNQHVAIIRSDNSKLSSDFLLYYLQAIKETLLVYAEIGATRNALTKGMIENLPVTIPPLPEQKAIAEVLSSLDDKIDLLHRQNKTLESLAQTLFRQWFIEEADDSWKSSTLSEHTEVFRGLSYRGSGLAEIGNGLPMHNLNSIYEFGGYKNSGIKYYSGEYRDRHIVKAGDIIVANTEQGHEFRLIGSPAIVPDEFGAEGLFSQHIYRLLPLPSTYLTNQYLYYLLMAPQVREQIIGATNGSTVNMLAIQGLQLPEFKLPPHEKVVEFSSITANYWKKKRANHQQIISLTRTRDSLLPKLMSGEAIVKV
ncbi:MAG: restriction endonuclease subunit S [Pyrinomonadaceae bacterium]